MDVIKVILTTVMRYITIETRDINDDLIMNVQSDMTHTYGLDDCWEQGKEIRDRKSSFIANICKF